MRFCLSIDHGEWSRGDPATAVERTLAFARLADEAGLDSIWLNEDPDGWDAFAVLGAMSRETASVRLGAGVTNLYHRNPNLIAASVATVDQLSGGRAFLGLGRGQPEIYDRIFKLDVDHPLQKMEDGLALLRQWWSQERTAIGHGLGGPWQRFVGPVQQPPVYIAAVGPKALQFAGQHADGVLFNELATPDFVRWAVGVAAEAAVIANRNPQALRFFVNPATTVTDDPESVLEAKKAFMVMVHALPGMDRLLMSPDWDVSAIMADVRDAMRTEEILDRGGFFAAMRQSGDLARARAAIPLGLVEAASAIGSADYVRHRLGLYRDAGATDFFVNRRGMPRDPDVLLSMLSSITP